MASLDDLMRLGDPDEIRATITRLRAEIERLTLANDRQSTTIFESRTDDCLQKASIRLLESKLRLRLAENERLTAEVSQRNAYWSGMCDRLAVELGSWRERAEKAEVECEELRVDVMFAVENGARLLRLHKEDGTKEVRALNWSAKYLACDGTPADIRRAVREARNGVS